jgi:hypothetical protein
MNKPLTKSRLQRYYVLLQDEAASWRNLQVDVSAHTREEAGQVALRSRRGMDTRTWAVEVVVEQEAA